MRACVQLPEVPLVPEKSGRPAINRLILVCGPAGGAGGPGVKPALDTLTSHGVKAAPLIALGTPEASPRPRPALPLEPARAALCCAARLQASCLVEH